MNRYWCVICGVPFAGLEISQYPRSPVFKRYRQQALHADSHGSPCVTLNDLADDLDDHFHQELLIHDLQTYDSHVIRGTTIEWTRRAYFLGHDATVPVATPVSILEFYVFEADHFPTGTDQLSDGLPLHPGTPNSTTTFHWSCMQLLARAIGRSSEIEHLDYETLNCVFTDTRILQTVAESLPRQDFWQKRGDFWTINPSVAGGELCVCNPGNSHHRDVLALQLQNRSRLARSKPKADLHPHIYRDPFLSLPTNVIHHITNHLHGSDLFACFEASWILYARTNDEMYWSRRIHADMPWFWELRELLHAGRLDGLDLKGIYVWLFKVTRPQRWMTGDWMDIANRRRIWVVCEQLAHEYRVLEARGEQDESEKLMR